MQQFPAAAEFPCIGRLRRSPARAGMEEATRSPRRTDGKRHGGVGGRCGIRGILGRCGSTSSDATRREFPDDGGRDRPYLDRLSLCSPRAEKARADIASFGERPSPLTGEPGFHATAWT
ncbi:MAG: hypothetical protein ACLR4Z_06510 [Butyricicoccaceae bacterium]